MRKFGMFAAMTMLVLFAGMSLNSCSYYQRVIDFSIMSTKEIDIEGKYIRKDIVRGESKVPIFLGFGFGMPKIHEACANALDVSGGDYLTNVVVEYGSNGLIPIFWKQGYEVYGHYWVKASASDLESGDLSDVFELRATPEGLAMVNVEDASQVELVITNENLEDLVEVREH